MGGAQKAAAAGRDPTRRLPRAARRRQLLDVALVIVREEGADRLTLGHLAERAGVSKPVAYDHFETRSGLLIDLYRTIDEERVAAFRDAALRIERGRRETVAALASAYVDCAADTTGDFHAVGAALAGNQEKAAVFQELLANCVQMFVAVLAPHADLDAAELERRCIALVGAGEALSGAVVRGALNAAEAVETFAALIDGALPPAKPGRIL